MKRSSPIKRKTRIKPKRRSASDFARVYGSKARVAWVKSLPCIMCGQTPCDNAHIENGGMGRKADYTKIVPLCCMAMDASNSPGYPRGHHGLFHQLGRDGFVAGYKNPPDLDAAAAATESAWQAFSGAVSGASV